jgi:hypothetical protein
VIQPRARFLRAYQKMVYLRGTLLLLFVLAGAIGVALGVRRKTRVAGTGWGRLALLPWLTGVALIVLPPMTAGFSYRYVLAAVPAICLAAGLAFAGTRRNLAADTFVGGEAAYGKPADHQAGTSHLPRHVTIGQSLPPCSLMHAGMSTSSVRISMH